MRREKELDLVEGIDRQLAKEKKEEGRNIRGEEEKEKRGSRNFGKEHHSENSDNEENEIVREKLEESKSRPAEMGHSGSDPIRPGGPKDKMKGSIVGAFIGDALGAPLEFQNYVSDSNLKKALEMDGGGSFAVGPGQITDDSELALSLLLGIQEGKGVLDYDLIVKEYGRWIRSPPFGDK